MNNKMADGNPKTSTFASKMGNVIANVLIGCISACIAAICIALTYRFIIWVL